MVKCRPLCPSQEAAVCAPSQAGLGCTQLLWEIRQEALQAPQGNRRSGGGNKQTAFPRTPSVYNWGRVERATSMTRRSPPSKAKVQSRLLCAPQHLRGG